jgi:tRNA-specific adenosine deaminase 1
LAAFVVEDGEKLEVISMACGTKSIGKKFMRKDGLQLNDMHAEILARRGFIKCF